MTLDDVEQKTEPEKLPFDRVKKQFLMVFVGKKYF